MFFIMGTGEDAKELRTFHNVICPCCGRYIQVKLIMRYRYFHIFFLPIIKYRKEYIVLPSCGCSEYEADGAYAEELKTAERIDMNRLNLRYRRNVCRRCLRELGPGFEYCPYCGEKQ